MLREQTISVIIPCKNEADALRMVFEKLPEEVDEVIVINNGSTDETAEIAKKTGAKVFSETRHINGIGYGYALATGIRNAASNIIVCMDGDGSYPASEIPKLITILQQKNLDFINCSRLPFQEPKQMSKIRTFGVQILNLLVCILFGYKIQDSLSGMWVFRKNIIHDLSLLEGGWNFSLEIKLNALANPKIKFAEYNISYHDRVFGQSKQNIFKTGIAHIIFLFRMRFYPRLRVPNLSTFFLKKKID